MRKTKRTAATLALAMLLAIPSAFAAQPAQSVFDEELQKTRYSLTDAGVGGDAMLAQVDEADQPLIDFAESDAPTSIKYKSPVRAFLYSLAVPGLGQYYYGSKLKPLAFVAVEAFGIVMATGYHGDGNDLTVEYEEFNRLNWKQDRYEYFLDLTYGTLRPDLEEDATGKLYTEISHVLPDEKSQQYYEMTGKYDQFSWGWVDAVNNDEDSLYDLTPPGSDHRMTSANPDAVPNSVMRDTYETMRDNANNKYEKSKKMVFALMVNHLLSAFEAYFTTKSINNSLRHEQEFSQRRWNMDCQVRSWTSNMDTPYLSLSYSF